MGVRNNPAFTIRGVRKDLGVLPILPSPRVCRRRRRTTISIFRHAHKTGEGHANEIDACNLYTSAVGYPAALRS